MLRVGELPQLTVDNTIVGKKEMFKYVKEEVPAVATAYSKLCDLDAVFPEEIQKEIVVYSYLIETYANSVYVVKNVLLISSLPQSGRTQIT